MKTLPIFAAAMLYVGSLTTSTARAQDLSLQDLFNGATITAGDKLFSNWHLENFATQGDTLGNPAGIFVTPLTDDPLNPGVKFNIPNGLGTTFDNAGNSYVLLDFSFDVQTTSGEALIKDNSLRLTGYTIDATPQGILRISEQITDANNVALGAKSVTAVVNELLDDPNHFDSAEFVPQSFVHIVKNIEILGPNTFDGVILTMFEQRFSQVPEPGSVMLLAIGLVIVGWLRVHRNVSRS